VPAANQAVVEEFIKNIDSVNKIKELALKIKKKYNKDFYRIDIEGVNVIFHWGYSKKAHAINSTNLKKQMKAFLSQQFLTNPNILDELKLNQGGAKRRTRKNRTHKKSHKKHYKKILKNNSTYKVRGRNLRKTKWMH